MSCQQFLNVVHKFIVQHSSWVAKIMREGESNLYAELTKLVANDFEWASLNFSSKSFGEWVTLWLFSRSVLCCFANKTSVQGNRWGAAALCCEIWPTIESTVRHLLAFLSHLHSPFCLTDYHNGSGRLPLSPNHPKTKGVSGFRWWTI